MTIQEFRNKLLAAAAEAERQGFRNTQKALLDLLSTAEQEVQKQAVVFEMSDAARWSDHKRM